MQEHDPENSSTDRVEAVRPHATTVNSSSQDLRATWLSTHLSFGSHHLRPCSWDYRWSFTEVRKRLREEERIKDHAHSHPPLPLFMQWSAPVQFLEVKTVYPGQQSTLPIKFYESLYSARVKFPESAQARARVNIRKTDLNIVCSNTGFEAASGQ